MDRTTSSIGCLSADTAPAGSGDPNPIGEVWTLMKRQLVEPCPVQRGGTEDRAASHLRRPGNLAVNRYARAFRGEGRAELQAQQGKTDECRSVTPSFRRVADTALQIVLSFEQNGGVNAQLGPVHRQERLHMSVTKMFCGGALCMVS